MYLYTICSIWKLSFTINTKWSHPGQSIFNEVFFLKVINLYITKSDSISLQKIFTWEENNFRRKFISGNFLYDQFFEILGFSVEHMNQ